MFIVELRAYEHNSSCRGVVTFFQPATYKHSHAHTTQQQSVRIAKILYFINKFFRGWQRIIGNWKRRLIDNFWVILLTNTQTHRGGAVNGWANWLLRLLLLLLMMMMMMMMMMIYDTFMTSLALGWNFLCVNNGIQFPHVLSDKIHIVVFSLMTSKVNYYFFVSILKYIIVLKRKSWKK